LCEAGRLIRSGSRSAAEVKRGALAILASNPEIRVEYLEIVDPTFHVLETVTGEVRIAAAVWLGQVRLIDNLKV
jgi:pantoate--beta-alanine ligase